MLNANKFRTIYDDFLASGLTVRDFCSNQNMHEAKFYYWQNKLKGILPPKKGFVPMVFEKSQPLGETTGVERLQHSSGDGSAIPCEITYPNGVCLKLEKMPGLDVLQSLLLLNPGQHV